ncbi:MAG: hypothetical protein HQK49_18390 [Oligoflexia bacterium]|nr:hypothetical protein [Oligoflexia bacterium]
MACNHQLILLFLKIVAPITFLFLSFSLLATNENSILNKNNQINQMNQMNQVNQVLKNPDPSILQNCDKENLDSQSPQNNDAKLCKEIKEKIKEFSKTNKIDDLVNFIDEHLTVETLIPKQSVNTQSVNTQSEAHAKILLGDDYKNFEDATNILTKKNFNKSQETIKKIALKAIERERELLSSGYYVFYHACSDQNALLADIITEFKKYLFFRENVNPLPYLNSPPNNPKKLSIHNLNLTTQDIDARKQVNSIICGNISFFGNVGVAGECSLNILRNNQNIGLAKLSLPNEERICEMNLLRDLINPNIFDRKKLMELVEAFKLLDTGGVLFQIFVNQNEVNNAVAVVDIQKSKVITKNTKKFIDEVYKKPSLKQNSDPETKKEHNKYQARIYLHPTIFNDTSKVKTFVYYSKTIDEKNEKIYREKLRAFVKAIFKEWLSNVLQKKIKIPKDGIFGSKTNLEKCL